MHLGRVARELTIILRDIVTMTLSSLGILWVIMAWLVPNNVLSSSPSSSCMARNLHLSPASDFDPNDMHATTAATTMDMYLSFTLDFKRCDHASPTIRYGEQVPSRDRTRTTRTTTSFEKLQFTFHESLLQKHSSSWIYHGVMEQLLPDTLYWYQVQVKNNDDDRILWNTDIINFQTPPKIGAPTTLAIVGDWGTSSYSMQTMETILRHTSIGRSASILPANPYIQSISALRTKHNSLPLPPSLPSSSPSSLPVSAVIVAGDLSYANGHLPTWEVWLDQMQPLFATTPILVAPGNHEQECDRWNFRIFQAYEHYFRTPYHHPPTHWDPVPLSDRLLGQCTHASQETWSVYEGGNSYYGYRHGMAHVIVLNSYTNTTKGSIQYTWLEQHLVSVNRSVTPWLIVVFHCPFYTTFRGHNNELNPKLMMQDMEPLFRQHHVNLIFQGHQHAYLRTHPMQGNNPANSSILSENGIVYLTVGTGGESHASIPIHATSESFVAYRDGTTYGAGQLQLVNATHAFWERLLIDSEFKDKTLRDPVWFVNKQWKKKETATLTTVSV